MIAFWFYDCYILLMTNETLGRPERESRLITAAVYAGSIISDRVKYMFAILNEGMGFDISPEQARLLEKFNPATKDNHTENLG